MAEVHFCDFCNEIIHGKKFIFATIEIDKFKSDGDYREFVPSAMQYEICEECKKVIEYLIKIRREKLNKLKKESNKLLKKNVKENKKEGGDNK